MPYRAQQHFADVEGMPQKAGQVIKPAQLQTKWEKMPAAPEEPSTSSGETHSTNGEPEGQGMAGAAFHGPHQEITKKESSPTIHQAEEPTGKKPEGRLALTLASKSKRPAAWMTCRRN